MEKKQEELSGSQDNDDLKLIETIKEIWAITVCPKKGKKTSEEMIYEFKSSISDEAIELTKKSLRKKSLGTYLDIEKKFLENKR